MAPETLMPNVVLRDLREASPASQSQASRLSLEQGMERQQAGGDAQESGADSPVTARGFLSPLGRSVVTALEAELDEVKFWSRLW